MLESICEELKLLVKNNFLALVVILLAALLYTLLIGNLYKGGIIQHTPVAVCDLDNSAYSRQFIQAVSEADQYDLRYLYNEEKTALDALAQKKAELILVIPPDFSQSIVSGKSVNVNYVVDGTNALQSGYASLPMQLVIGSFNADIKKQFYLTNAVPYLPVQAVQLSTRVMQNSTKNYAEFYLYGILLAAAQFGTMLVFGYSIFRDKKRKQPLKNRLLLWSAKGFLYLILSLIGILLGCLIILSVWQLPLQAPIIPLLLIFSCFICSIMGISGFIALLCKHELAFTQCIALYTLPSFLLAGYIWPELGMILPVKILSYCLPLHYILNDFRSLAITSYSVNLWIHCGQLLFIGILLFIIDIVYEQRLNND